MRRIWRLALVAATAAAAFSLAIVRFNDAAAEGCAQRVRQDTSYEVRWNEQPRTDLNRYRLSVTQGGRPVTGAEVCLNAYMKGMSAMAVADRGREVDSGSYEMSLIFEMGGRWPGRVLIAEPGRSVVAVPLDLEVRMAPAPATAPS